MEGPRVVAGNFALSFQFSHISEHFPAYLRLHYTDHSDLSIIGKIFSSCRTWVQMMPILVEGDDVIRKTKAITRQSRLLPALESMG